MGGGDAEDGVGVRVDGEQSAREARAPQIAQDGPADGSGPPARADDRDRLRAQQRAQTRHIRSPPALFHGAQIIVGLGQPYDATDLRPVEVAAGAQPQVSEDLEHFMVLGERVRGEGGDAVGAGRRDQVLQQQRSDTAVMPGVGDGEGDFGGA